MLISYCVPCMNRAYDLKITLPFTIIAANNSQPIEIVILDYDSKDNLVEYVEEVQKSCKFLLLVKSYDHKYYSPTHARNIVNLASHGEYIITSDVDIILHDDFFKIIRNIIEKENPVWMYEKKDSGIMGRPPIFKRDEYIAAGGYDERFNVCGPDDKDICMRMLRRGGKHASYPMNLYEEIYTPYKEKYRNMDITPYKNERQIKLMMSRAMRKFYEENNEKGSLVANEGKDWGVP